MSSNSSQNSTNFLSLPNRHRANLSQRLNKVIEINEGYQFIQQNGQRIFEPSPMIFNPPPKGCEIFIGNIPKHIYEDELIPLFQQVGQIYKFRLMLDFNQRNRGYAFATYFFTRHAKVAVESYNGYILGNGAALAVFKSIDNRRLFVGCIPRNKTQNDVLQLFHRYVDGLLDVIMYPSWTNQAENRGFAFLEFVCHTAASVARRQLHPRNLLMDKRSLYVDWADPLPDVDPLVMEQVTVLYVKNLPFHLNNDEVYTMFRNMFGSHLIKKTHKTCTFSFVHCYNRTSAEIVMKNLTGFHLDGKMLEIEWARPREYSVQFRSTQPPDNFCLSVPLHSRKRIMDTTNTRRTLPYAASDMSRPSTSTSSSEDSA